MDANFIILIITGLVLLTTLILVYRHRKIKLPGHSSEYDDPFQRIEELRTQFPLPSDQLACDRIEKELGAVSRTFTLKTSIAPKKIYTMAADLTREIAAVYYPDADNPALMASLADLLKLDERIVTRLNLKIQEFPLKTVKDISIGKILAGKDYYDSKIKNKLEWFKKYKTIYKLGSNAWLSYNALNPWYWGRKLAYTSAREITFRYLLNWIVTIVGEEAMAVYGRRDINTLEAVFERDLAFAMIDLVRVQPDIHPATYAAVLNHILNKARLSDTVRVSVLRALMAKRRPAEFTPSGTYTKKQTQKMMARLKYLVKATGEPDPDMQERLEAIENTVSGALTQNVSEEEN